LTPRKLKYSKAQLPTRRTNRRPVKIIPSQIYAESFLEGHRSVLALYILRYMDDVAIFNSSITLHIRLHRPRRPIQNVRIYKIREFNLQIAHRI